jgi:hypothetical protein
VLLFVIETSSWMDSDVYGGLNGNTQFGATAAALGKAFDAMPPDTAVGLLYYPNSDECFVAPAEGFAVPPAPLDTDQIARLEQSLQAQVMLGETPMQDGLRHAYAELPEAVLPELYTHSPRHVVVISASAATRALDCAVSTGSEAPVTRSQLLSMFADVGLAQEMAMSTFVVGLPGSSRDWGNESFSDAIEQYLYRNILSRLAVSGGTALAGCNEAVAPTTEATAAAPFCHYDLTEGPDTQAALTGVLDQIASRAVSCNYALPATLDPTFDPDPATFVVRYTPSASASPELLTYQSDSACSEGFAVEGDRLRLCSDTCNRRRPDGAGTVVEIEYRCAEP